MNDATKKELQSAVFERLIEHLQKRKDVQQAKKQERIEDQEDLKRIMHEQMKRMVFYTILLKVLYL